MRIFNEVREINNVNKKINCVSSNCFLILISAEHEHKSIKQKWNKSIEMLEKFVVFSHSFLDLFRSKSLMGFMYAEDERKISFLMR